MLGIILGLLLPLAVSPQTWKVYGIDTNTFDCVAYPHITIFNDVPYSGLYRFDSTTGTKIEAPSLLFSCDVSKSDKKGNLWFVGSTPPDIWTTHGSAFTIYKYDGSNWSDYSLPQSYGYNGCNSIAFQKDGKIWFSTIDSGAYMYDGLTWHHHLIQAVFDWSNAMAIDSSGNKWFATQKGLIEFDGSHWTVFNSSNSGLKFNVVNNLAIDKSGNIWLATGSADDHADTINGRIARFDGVNWEYYKAFTDGSGSNYVNSIAIDSDGKIWAGTNFGLTVFDGSKWTNYMDSHTSSGNLQVLSIDFDSRGNKWFGTNCGILELLDNPESIYHSTINNKICIYPNPAYSKINIYLSDQGTNGKISILHINGSIVLTRQISGENLQLDISNLKQGVYFIYINIGSESVIKKLIKN
jgi:ligand-binding sensor domain-containing protein